ncbi:OmpP1/FadL family transporter [Riemerella anatipestifer]|uniref:OmpP1/FadL family transporter n=1 Tax=Riemerella anatipestifer TaxID=34085 RepID=UPI001BDAA25D|nr:hemin receptor [Riemerella anatipestifer]MBT0551869.1 hemin receptor [Riemerella anatipestifer]MBT0554047.1 hemin receptor [Riemerella anatipestifer]MCE3024646.1 hemin receptor [Riemerella anatipestifer]MCU7560319.1 hemin receptor [Riemerella anatipestifer]MDY3449595.1 hemin receptor [Riemerella anatipestifer]
MNKKLFSILGLSVGALFYSQDVSVIRNTVDVYSDTQPNGSAKYMGMAGAMGAMGGDASSINVNPAGIAVNIVGEFSGTLNALGNKNTSTLANKSYDKVYKKTNLGHLGGVVVMQTSNNSKWKFINLGFNYSAKDVDSYIRTPENHTINEAIDYTDSNGNSQTDLLLYDGHAYNRVGHTSKLSFAFGGNYDHKWYVGGGVHFHSANIEQGDFFRVQSQTAGTKGLYQKQETPFQESSGGVAISAGVIGKIDKNFRVGLALESPTWWNIERAYNYYDIDNNGVVVTALANENRRLSTPMKATLSGAYIANKNFAVNVDYTLGVTKPQYNVQGGVEKQLNEFFSKVYSNTSELRLGAEYRLDNWRFRGGYAYQSNPFSSSSLSVIDPASNLYSDRRFSNLYLSNRQTLGVGLGYNFKSFYVDAAYQNASSKFANPFYAGEYASPVGDSVFNEGHGVEQYDSIVSDVKTVRNNFVFTVGWRF